MNLPEYQAGHVAVTYISWRSSPVRAFVLLVIIVTVLIHIEHIISHAYAPETVLVQVADVEQEQQGEETECFADIISSLGTQDNKPLRKLGSIYDYLDADSFVVAQESGFFLLETGLQEYSEDFEIRIVCYAPDFVSVSYTIINQDNQARCGLREEGRVVVC